MPSSIKSVGGVVQSHGFGWITGLFARGYRLGRVYSEVSARFPELSVDDVSTYVTLGFRSFSAGQQSVLGGNAAIDAARSAPFGPEIPSGVWRYKIVVEGNDMLTGGLRLFRNIETDSDRPLTPDELDAIVSDWIGSRGAGYNIKWGSDPIYTVRSVVQGF